MSTCVNSLITSSLHKEGAEIQARNNQEVSCNEDSMGVFTEAEAYVSFQPPARNGLTLKIRKGRAFSMFRSSRVEKNLVLIKNGAFLVNEMD